MSIDDENTRRAVDFDGMLQQMRKDSDDWFGEGTSTNLTVMTLGLVGESGEVADIVKKLQRGSLTMAEAATGLAEELVDVLHYWMMLIGMLGVDVMTVYEKKREYNVARFGDGSRGRIEPPGSGV
jgi:NTP pyrophosphatase (non-canonical NTP hydrolase)